MLKLVPILLLAGASAFAPSSSPRDAHIARKIPLVVVHAKEFGYSAPATIAPGMTTFRLINDGKELHQVTILKLENGKTLADFQAAIKTEGPPPSWITAVGGPNAAEPGKTVEATLNIDAGNYIMVCFIPSPGEMVGHLTKGMIQPLTVAAGGVTQAGAPGNAVVATPVPEIHLVMKEYGYTFSKPITTGKHVIHVMNEGMQDHEVVFLKLAPGKHGSDFVTWIMTGSKGAPPASSVDGMATMGKGRSAMFTANLTPGRYALVCFVGDSKDGKPHAEHGMVNEFEIK